MSSVREPDRPTEREFAFSRIAGATAADYAAVSGSAVAALVVSLFSWLGLLWVWLLTVAAAGMALALLALYRIATSAGTLTGRKLALAAIVLSLAGGGAAGFVQLREWRHLQADVAEVRALAAQAAEDIRVGRYDQAYGQLAPQYQLGVPRGYWRYEWVRFFDARGPARRVELGERAWTATPGEVIVTIKIFVDNPQAGEEGEGPLREIPVRLAYHFFTGQADGHAHEHTRADHELAEQHEHGEGGEGSPVGWRIADLPDLITPLPPPYAEPLVWPAPGPTRTVWLDKDRKETAVLALPPLVPPSEDGYPPPRPWLTERPPPPPHEHHH